MSYLKQGKRGSIVESNISNEKYGQIWKRMWSITRRMYWNIKQITKKVHLSSQVNKRLRKWKGQLRMDNPVKLLTLGTQDIRQRQTKQKTKKKPQKTKPMSNIDPTKNKRWTQAPAKSNQFLSLVWHPRKCKNSKAWESLFYKYTKWKNG
jgi:hypothetical protein